MREAEKRYSLSDVESGDGLVAIGGKVYDVSRIVAGGGGCGEAVGEVVGTDASERWGALAEVYPDVALSELESCCVGILSGATTSPVRDMELQSPQPGPGTSDTASPTAGYALSTSGVRSGSAGDWEGGGGPVMGSASGNVTDTTARDPETAMIESDGEEGDSGEDEMHLTGGGGGGGEGEGEESGGGVGGGGGGGDGGEESGSVAGEEEQGEMAVSPAIELRNPHDRPLHKLSVNLIVTYNHINDVYYAAKRKAKAAKKNAHDDSNHDYIIKEGEVFDGRYEILSRIGRGSFGQVAKGYDRVNKEKVALKIIKNKAAFFQQAKIERNLLEVLNKEDPDDMHCIVKLKDTFVYHNHLVLVFELLSYNLYDLLRHTNFQGVSLNLVRKFGAQILLALHFMSLPHINIIHCDLKPENILLRSPQRSAIKVIDFGSSCRATEKLYSYIQSRFYRSPEVLLGIPYTAAIDMWSLGCILVEMHTGEPLFAGRTESDQLDKIISVCGMPPESMLVEGVKVSRHFRVPDASSDDFVYRRKDKIVARNLEEILGMHSGGPKGRRKGTPGHDPEHYGLFIDLISKMLIYDPAERIDPATALNHPFIISPDISAAAAAASTAASSSSSSTTTSTAESASDGGGGVAVSDGAGAVAGSVTDMEITSTERPGA